MRIPLSWLRESAAVPADATAEDVMADLVAEFEETVNRLTPGRRTPGGARRIAARHGRLAATGTRLRPQLGEPGGQGGDEGLEPDVDPFRERHHHGAHRAGDTVPGAGE